MSDSQTDAKNRVQIYGPVYDLNNVMIAANSQEFWSGNLKNTISTNENKASSPYQLVYSGTGANGLRNANSDCANWTSLSGFDGAQAGRSEAKNSSWIQIYQPGSGSLSACSNLSRLYCIK